MRDGVERRVILRELSQIIETTKKAYEELESLRAQNKLDQEFYAMEFERLKQKLN